MQELSLYFDETGLTGDIDPGVLYDCRVTVFSANKNSLTGTVPAGLMAQVNDKLLLSQNELVAFSDAGGNFGPQVIDLSHNKITAAGIPGQSELSQMLGIRSFNFSYNEARGSANPFPLSTWVANYLSVFDISHNGFYDTLPTLSPPPGVWQGSPNYPKWLVFNLRDNMFHGLIPSSWELVDFWALDLADNTNIYGDLKVAPRSHPDFKMTPEGYELGPSGLWISNTSISGNLINLARHWTPKLMSAD